MENRLKQINKLIRNELSLIIAKEVEFPLGVLATVTRVETTPNLFQAKVFISVLPEEKSSEVFHILKKNIFLLQQKLNHRLRMGSVPKIEFVKEEKTGEAGRIEEILEKLKKEKNGL